MSWRQRYKNNIASFDDAIDSFVENSPPNESVQYCMDRRVAAGGRRLVKEEDTSDHCSELNVVVGKESYHRMEGKERATSPRTANGSTE
jgi:hypothetical protein